MIVLDTHIWVWWVHKHPRFETWMDRRITKHEADGIGISVISCWEVARLQAGGRLDLGRPVEEWFSIALAYPGVELIDLSPAISIDAINLPGELHKDTADRIIVASARRLDCELLTADDRLLKYPHVKFLTK